MNRKFFEVLLPLWPLYEEHIIPHLVGQEYGYPSLPLEDINATSIYKETYNVLFKREQKSRSRVGLTDVAMHIFSVMKIRKALLFLREKDPISYDWVDISDVSDTGLVMQLLEFCKIRYPERRLIVFPMLALNHALGLAGAASGGADNVNTFNHLNADSLRITWNGGSVCDKGFFGIHRASDIWENFDIQDQSVGLARILFEQRECLICLQELRVGTTCTNRKCQHMICHVCMETGVRKLDMVGIEVPESTRRMVEDIVPLCLQNNFTFEGFGQGDAQLSCPMCRIGSFYVTGV